MSIKEIAEKVGVSVSTVSRVLSKPEYKCSSKELREQIFAAAREMNYVPNESAKNLRSGEGKRAEPYGLSILVTRTGSSDTDPFFGELIGLLRSEINKNMCMLMRIWYRPEFSDEGKCAALNIKQKVKDIAEARYTKPMLTTISLPKEEMAKFAVYLLLDRMNGGHRAVMRTEFECSLVVRSSCSPVNNSEMIEYYI